ncbi:response regulator transcription factor [Leucobacter sp. M11]|uniref:response regulator transcription factor n=1 Tax=Leucobacter sp. M11 TaxID=2993565 RepID=UPI002D7EDBFF|nr:response regulator transcription factor [Leucobacter sp. M11]MEB4613569.1 response regulator transcription factor [Leucobacter sp. M11]
MHLLLIEDDDVIAAALSEALSLLGHRTERYPRGTDALRHHREADVILLDLGLPDLDGIDVLASLRRVTRRPILVLTAREDERSIVRALRLGADDYLVKPIRLSELMARIEAVQRRLRPEATGGGALQLGPLRLDPGAHGAHLDGHALALTPTEYRLLAALVEAAGTVVTREELLDTVWGDAFLAHSRSLDVHLTALRAKLGRPGLLVNVRGVGYRLDPDAAESA